ncbi:MAG TPA: discoidin domain-containing protein, partial [Blastocatellia bacterium]|nr:discoidin domain-containing protein [Blastocatellia bacterium]
MLQKFKLIVASLAVTAALAVTPVLAQQPTVQARAVTPAAVQGTLLDITKTNDGQPDTRAYSASADYTGQSVILDVGGEQNIVGVTQEHGRWPTHYPGAYRVEVGLTASGPWLKVAEEPGKRGVNRVLFEPVRGRFIRITATNNKGGNVDWSIAELKAIVDPGATNPRRIETPGERPPAEERPRPAPDARISGDLKDLQLALDRDPNTRAVSESPNYAGKSFTFDLGGEYELSRVVQAHGQWPGDFPAEYKIEVSRRRDEREFREVWRGEGSRHRSVAEFAPVNTRYVRITALRDRDRANLWSIAELRTNRDPDPIEDEDSRLVDRQIRRATAQGFAEINLAVDDNRDTRASTGRAGYAGSFVVMDLGGSYTVSRVVQIHNPSDRDYPGRYKVEVSDDGNRWQTVFEGEGTAGRSRA